MVETPPIQLVDGGGLYNNESMTDFAKTAGLNSVGLNYQVVAIMGPQSSGKSTLMNHLFGTRFQEMDALSGRKQTTKGIWLAKAPHLTDLITLVLDLEGTDGRERGEDDTTFERQSALFALAVADVVMINVWCHDVGREHGAGKPLIKTVLQVNLKLFTPSPGKRKTVLVFVIRDKSKTPLERLQEVLEQDMLNIWDSIIKPAQYEKTTFNDFFDVRFEALSNYEEKEKDFADESRSLRTKFTLEGEGSFIKIEGRLPGDAVALSTERVWEVIKSQKDLDLPAHKIMVATTRCTQIQHDQLEGLKSDQLWEQLLAEGDEKLLEDFGERMSALVDSCVTGYDEDAMYFDANIRAEKRTELLEKVTQLTKHPYEKQIAHLHTTLNNEFKKELKLGIMTENVQFSDCATELKEAAQSQFIEKQKQFAVQHLELESPLHLKCFVEEIENHITGMKVQKMEELKAQIETLFSSVLSNPLVDLFNDLPTDLWMKVRQILSTALSRADSLKNKELQGYDLSAQEQETLDAGIRSMALKLLDFHAKEAAHTVLSRMKDKFTNSFGLDANRLPRTWTSKDNLAAIAKVARMSAADVLAQLAVSQPEKEDAQAEKIEQAIIQMAERDLDVDKEKAAASQIGNNSEIDMSVAVDWAEMETRYVLIAPPAVRTTWRQFMTDTKMQITQASMTQMANKLASNRVPPIWAILAMLFLGFNEFVSVLYSPLLALLLILLLLFCRSLYIEMDVYTEIQKGALPGVIALAAKFIPSVKSVSSKTLASMTGFFQQPQDQQQNSGDLNSNGESSQQEISESAESSSSGLRQRVQNTPEGPERNIPAVIFEHDEEEEVEASKNK